MNDDAELFPTETCQQLSPRLIWLRTHGLVTNFAKCLKVQPWTCAPTLQHLKSFRPEDIGTGDTEEEACADYAQKKGLAGWNV